MPKKSTGKSTTKKKAAPKKAVPKKAAKSKRSAALSEERTHKLTKAQLLKWRTLFAEMQGSGAKVEANQLKLAEAQRKFVQVVRSIPAADALYRDVESLTGTLQAQTKAFKERKTEHHEYVESIREKLGLDGMHISIDPETGLVREIEAGG